MVLLSECVIMMYTICDIVEQLVVQGTARQIHSIATHPSQPDKCASGGSNGTIAVWDLRFTSAPLAASTGTQNAGDVWQVNGFREAQAATVSNFVIQIAISCMSPHATGWHEMGPCLRPLLLFNMDSLNLESLAK